MKNKIEIKRNISEEELGRRDNFFKMFKTTPIPDEELMMNLGLYTNRQALSRIFFMHDLYKRIVNIHRVIMEFGCRWGQNLALFESFRGMYEPYNYNRKIIGFDTFQGFDSINEKDGKASIVKKGAYSVTENYEKYLEDLLLMHEKESPISHKVKFELVKGDATLTINN